jgi:uncharacterized protein
VTISAFPYAQPLEGLIGGILIGLAAAMMLLGAGRIAGVSGILARAATIGSGDMAQTSAWGFLIGLPAGTAIVALVGGAEVPQFTSWPVLIVAGVLVGFGTRLGSGCTSGHGVCGISRFSQRSIVATCVFIGAGVSTVFVTSLLGGM